MSRLLTEHETMLAKQIYRNGINTAAIRVSSRNKSNVISPHTAITVRNTLYFPVVHYQQDFSQSTPSYQAWFIHELAHVWQHHLGFPVLMSGVRIALCGGYYRHRAYQYGDLTKYRQFNELNMEQQANIFAHFFLAKHHDDGRYILYLPHYRRLLSLFYRYPLNRQLLPHV